MDNFVAFLLGVLVAVLALGALHSWRRKCSYGDGLMSALGGGGPGTPEDEG